MDEDQGDKVAQHFKDEINRIYDRTINELERVLKDAPPSNGGTSIFKQDDCTNTKDFPDLPPVSEVRIYPLPF